MKIEKCSECGSPTYFYDFECPHCHADDSPNWFFMLVLFAGIPLIVGLAVYVNA